MRAFELRFRRPVPGGEPSGEGFALRWQGTAVMGIVNVTPDSFSDGGHFANAAAAIDAGLAMAAAGALLVDVGGESTRPGATPVPAHEELSRVLPVIKGLAAGEVAVSIDTSKPDVAREALSAGACLVNDVRGLRDPALRAVCAEAGAPAVLMHMQGTPETMQCAPSYGDVVEEVSTFLRCGAERALKEGIVDIIVDPGIGFGKRLEHNLALLRALPRLASGHPLLIGASRKQLIESLSGETAPTARDPGSLALHLHAAASGAAMVRAHDVAAHLQALRVWEGIGG
ncbi:MAG: dihydropteroate synthase [Truepera sp.]|nr:dihydropteroate synthase [Truepera sp.]